MLFLQTVRSLTLVLAAIFYSMLTAYSDEPVRVMLVAGQNNHNWKQSTPYLNHIIGSHEKLDCTIDNAPSKNKPEAWDDWRPKFIDYDVVVLNYNGREWPERIKKRFDRYIRSGGNAVLIHAANNAFTGWTEFEEMVGLLWRSPNYGPGLYFDDRGNKIQLARGDGKMGHGGIFDWVVKTHDTSHPITKGMPKHWMHASDELYHGQRGPAKNLNVLFTAYSDPRHGGTGRHEPVVWWIPHGKGKVVTNLMGHVGDLKCMQCVGFQTVLQRSCLWLAGAAIESKVPDAFPISSQTSVVEMSEDVVSAIENSRLETLNVQIEPRANGLSDLETGLKYSVYLGSWGQLPNFDDLTAETSGTTDDVSLQVTEHSDQFAVVFSGYVVLDEPGEYAFFTRSDDGSRLLLGGVEIVDNDGIHGANEEGARLYLDAGVYPIEIQFFEAEGGEVLDVSFSRTGKPKQPISAASFFH